MKNAWQQHMREIMNLDTASSPFPFASMGLEDASPSLINFCGMLMMAIALKPFASGKTI